MVESKKQNKKLSAYWWWNESQNNSSSITRKSTWLQSALLDLDEKTESMLKLIEDDADSFAKRAEMYYKKRPELISIIEDFYRTHRSLALRYDQATKFESSTRVSTQNQTTYHPKTTDVDKCYDTYSESSDFDHHNQESGESEIDDHQIQEEDVTLSELNNEEVIKLRQEIDRLKEENKAQKEKLLEKDEAKREAIRQLSVSIDILKQENLYLKKRVAK
uniref:protein NETWORKED 3A-like n=1 Tax=Erigeron canadensis TaxID=72917 RepID=UPI001CB91AD7|nr:protein NETWORKED 3A-like [Erigeron canadensis]